ncbi:ABC transporter substrate-binding protein [Pseudoalteromonas luteoviolacea]|nr:ABC transporter substrate-binding protein [Pseudoalteromonas luteoviolacea]AOT15185.1 ABC transporter substrate-binding protein [Pseudoalteromonas luteoviolacea]AOT20100.1 ABC transporter substrate-binding protein [Pseudoalteromonas luteoviolacea]
MRVLLWIAAVIFMSAFFGVYHFLEPLRSETLKLTEEYTEIPQGETFTSLCAKWQSQQALVSCLPYKFYSKLYPQKFTLKAGIYKLKNMTVVSAIEKINLGEKADFTFTIIEGDTYKTVVKNLQNSAFLIFDIEDTESARFTQFGNNHPEGWLYPDTYHYEGATRASALINRAHQKMKTVLSEAWDKRDKNLPLKTQYEALILASIIEKESGEAAERDIISSVFHNRLNKGMRLQTDPTVIYGLGERFDGDIKRSHLREYTPYNTYRIDRFPPTPIAMPSHDALIAAVQPAQTDYFYFVSKGNGEHHFSKSLKEHNRAVRKYILNQK